MDQTSQLRNLQEQMERMELFNAGVSLTATGYQIRALEESNAALTSRLMLVEGTVKTQERLLRDVINHLRNAGGDKTIMQESEHTLKTKSLQGEVTMREQMVAQLTNEAATQQATLTQILASMEDQTEATTRTKENQTFTSYSTHFFIPNVAHKTEELEEKRSGLISNDACDPALPSTIESTEKADSEKGCSEDDSGIEENDATQNDINNQGISELKETDKSLTTESSELLNESVNLENKDTVDTDREKPYTKALYDELHSKGSFTAFPNEEGSLDDSSSWGNDSVDYGARRRESMGSEDRLPRTPRSGQKTRRSLNEKPRWRR